MDLSSRQPVYYDPLPYVREKSQLSVPFPWAQHFRPAPAFQPSQLTVSPPTATFPSSEVVLANPSDVQARHVYSEITDNPPGPSNQQPRAPLYRHQPSAAVPHPQAVSAHHYPAPSSLHVQNAATSYQAQSVSQYPPQQPPRPHRAHPVAAPSFPYFTHEDPLQFGLLTQISLTVRLSGLRPLDRTRSRM